MHQKMRGARLGSWPQDSTLPAVARKAAAASAGRPPGVRACQAQPGSLPLPDQIPYARTHPRSPCRSKHPIKYMYVSLAAPDTYKSGSGSVVITLPVLRAPVTVAYVRLNDKNYYTPGIWAYLVTVASAVAKAPAEAQAPHNIKLSVATNGVATRFG